MRRTLVVNSSAGNGGRGGDPLLPVLSPGAGGNGGRGGAIASFGSLVVEDSTLANNRSGHAGQPGTAGLSSAAGGDGGDGGAIYVAGGVGRTTMLANVTLTSNSAGNGLSGGAAGNGGAIGADGGGGDEAMVIRHATILGNIAGAGAAATGGGVAATTAAGALVIQNSILSKNVAAGSGNCSGDSIGDGGNNISFGSGGCPEGFDQGDPNLDPGGAKDNGGPTPTIAIKGPGAALNKVAASGEHCTGRDQRGFLRPQGATCDIGAYEFKAPDCDDAAAETKPGGKVRINLHCSGPGKVTYVKKSDPVEGTVASFSTKEGVATYRADRRFRGTDTFRYTGSNVAGEGSGATITVTIDGPPPPPNKFSFGRVDLNRENGTAKLPVKVPGPGKLKISGKGVRDVSRSAKKKGTVKMPVTPVKQARKRLKRSGVATVSVKVAFKPKGGFTRTRSRDIRLRINSFFVPI